MARDVYIHHVMETTPHKLTAAQYRALRTVLASGGLWPHDLHMGSLKRHGGERRTMIARLCKLGLVEGVAVEAPHRQQYAGSPDTWVGRATQDIKYFATAAGCSAFNAYEAALSEDR